MPEDVASRAETDFGAGFEADLGLIPWLTELGGDFGTGFGLVLEISGGGRVLVLAY
jgi:hypothetical protein